MYTKHFVVFSVSPKNAIMFASTIPEMTAGWEERHLKKCILYVTSNLHYDKIQFQRNVQKE